MKEKIIKLLMALIFAFSGAVLSCQLIVIKYYNNFNLIITFLISFVCCLLVYVKTKKDNLGNLKNNRLFSIICMFLSLLILVKFYDTKFLVYKKTLNELLFNPLRLRYIVISSISFSYLGCFIGNKINEFFKEFFSDFNSWDKRMYVMVSMISILLVVILYVSNSQWFLQYDKVYSIDSGFVFNNIYSSSIYYDVRHPLLNIYTFPLWAIVNTLVKFILPSGLDTVVSAVILQIISSQLLILIGFMLYKITKKKIVLTLYLLSFQTILFSIFFEKYQLCVFFIVLYVYNVCKKTKKEVMPLISSSVVMPTSVFIGVTELFNGSKLLEKFKKISKIVVITLLLFVCMGRVHLFQNGYTELIETKERFSNTVLTTKEKLISTTKVFQSSFTALSSSDNVREGKYWWINLSSDFSVLSIAIIFCVGVGWFLNRKDMFSKITFIWTLFSLVLFVVLNWSSHETPLFALYFSWAIIPLFIYGLETILNKIDKNINMKYVYGFIIFFMIIINFSTLIDISNFLSI